jgi:hypothetical protein
MKTLLLTVLTLCVFIFSGNAQEASVEKSIWGIQAGLHPLGIYNETGLTESIVLRSELGFGFAWSSSGGLFDNSTAWAVMPVVIVEPRYYYNLNRRLNKGRRIEGNSGNFLALSVGIQPDFGFTSDNVDLDKEFHVIPMWGIRRGIGNSFSFETSIGLGYGWSFDEYTLYTGERISTTDSGVVLGLRLALGYWF